MADVLIELDARRRTSLGKIGRHSRYLVHEEPDGTLIFQPAVVMTEMEARLNRDPELVARVKELLAKPAEGKQRPPRRSR